MGQPETDVQKLALVLRQRLTAQTGGAACAVVVNEAGYDGMAVPFAAGMGNLTDYAHMVRVLIAVALNSAPRPTDCLACQESYDALQRAGAEMRQLRGSC